MLVSNGLYGNHVMYGYSATLPPLRSSSLSPSSVTLFQRYTQMSSRIFALVIGIDYYKSGSIWNLHSCVDDAKKIKRWLTDDLRVPADHISTLLDRQATKQNIEDQFSQHLLNNRCIERGDAILVYFAGHGSRLPAPDPWYPLGTECQTVDVLCAYDHDTNTERGRQSGISDRSFNAMMNDLCSSKGNNITVVLDCCFAPTQNRANIRDRSITRWTRTAKATPDDLYRGLWPTARVAPSAATSGFYTAQASHVVLGACSSGEKAIEDKNGGRFTTFFLRAASLLHLHRTSYVQLMERASRIGGDSQTFLCMGENKDEMVFNEIPFPTDNAFVLASFDFDTQALRISKGAIHGLTKGSQLSLHLHNRQLSLNPPIANAVVSDVYGTWCFALVSKPLVDPPTSCWAKVTKWCTRRPFRVRLRPSWMPRNGMTLLRRSFSFGARGKAKQNVFDLQSVSQPELADVTLTLESRGITTVETIPVTESQSASVIKLKNKDPSTIIDHATRFSLHLHTGDTDGSLRDQVEMELCQLDPFSWAKVGNNLLSRNAEPIPYEEGAIYQIILHNKSNTDLWPYLAYFDTSRLSITMIWSPSPRSSSPPLPSQCSLQIGSGVPESEAIVFTLPEGVNLDISYLKLFFSSTPTSMQVIEQDLVLGLSHDMSPCADLLDDAYVEATWGSLTRTLCFFRL